MAYLVSLRHIFTAMFVLYGVAALAESNCPGVCQCAPSAPLCPAGISRVTDHCGCCKVCAKQFNEDCSITEPCDHIKGLHCHLGAGGEPHRGLCRAEAQGLSCEFGGRVYQHAEAFQPSCQHQCSCMNGVVGCMPLCPHLLPLPDWHCARPRLLTPPGGCCEEWACDQDNRISEEPAEPPYTHTHTHTPDHQPMPNHISTRLDALPQTRLQTFTEALLGSSCVPLTTAWTQCSTSCGMGISSRVTNENPGCHLASETRLCHIRECDPGTPLVAKGRKCQKTARPREPIRIQFGGCSSARRYRPRTCGYCGDGRCCSPSQSRTIRLRFRCPDGESFWRNIMWIQRCSCRNTCPHSAPSRPSISLHNDIHTFSR